MQLPIAGARVSQAQYGHGTVTYANEYHTVIEFDENGTRTFITARVELTPSDVAAPVKAKRVVRRKKAAAAPPEPEAASAEAVEADGDNAG